MEQYLWIASAGQCVCKDIQGKEQEHALERQSIDTCERREMEWSISGGRSRDGDKKYSPSSVRGKGEAGEPSCLPLERMVGCEDDQKDDGKDS
jgi:hypothetical protein